MIVKYTPQLKSFAFILLILQFIVIILYGVFVRNRIVIPDGHLNQYYPWFQDVNVMMLVGFGYLMAYIKFGGFSAIGFTFFINCIALEYYLIFQGLWQKAFSTFAEKYIYIDMQNMMQGSFAVAAVLISFGAILGRVGPLELLIMTVIQIFGYSLNERLIGGGILNVLDIGGSMGIHVYGAYFGLAFSYIIGTKKPLAAKQAVPNYNSYIFAMIGTVYLWMYWPSFNSGTSGYNVGAGSQYQRMITINNTILSLTGSCITAFTFSILFRNTFNMDDVVNATLSGGVAIGSAANLINDPVYALLVGSIVGIISTYGFFKVSTLLTNIGIYDTCGIHNLHAIPGVIGGIVSAIAIASYNSGGPSVGTASLDFEGINYLKQGWIQMGGLMLSLGMGVIFGIVSGFVVNIIYELSNNDFFEDSSYFQVPYQINYPHHIKEDAPY